MTTTNPIYSTGLDLSLGGRQEVEVDDSPLLQQVLLLDALKRSQYDCQDQQATSDCYHARVFTFDVTPAVTVAVLPGNVMLNIVVVVMLAVMVVLSVFRSGVQLMVYVMVPAEKQNKKSA